MPLCCPFKGEIIGGDPAAAAARRELIVDDQNREWPGGVGFFFHRDYGISERDFQRRIVMFPKMLSACCPAIISIDIVT
jgi:hypothetical protein